jgi:hypothetical protein
MDTKKFFIWWTLPGLFFLPYCPQTTPGGFLIY